MQEVKLPTVLAEEAPTVPGQQAECAPLPPVDDDRVACVCEYVCVLVCMFVS